MDEAYERRDRALRKLGFQNYASYLRSKLWKSIRSRVLERDSECRICSGPIHEVHHLSYGPATLAGRTLRFLLGLCRSCHTAIEIDGTGKHRTFRAAVQVARRMLAAAHPHIGPRWPHRRRAPRRASPGKCQRQ